MKRRIIYKKRIPVSEFIPVYTIINCHNNNKKNSKPTRN